MNEETKKRLAEAMGIDPGQIMDYKGLPGGDYNVILFNFQKYTGVVPAEAKPVSKRKSRMADRSTAREK